MKVELEKMCDWERKKAVFLLHTAETLGMDTSGYGELAVNSSSGNTYLWLEDHSFTLFMPINCDLKKTDILALWTCPEDGEEIESALTEYSTLEHLELWAQLLYEEHQKQHEEK